MLAIAPSRPSESQILADQSNLSLAPKSSSFVRPEAHVNLARQPRVLASPFLGSISNPTHPIISCRDGNIVPSCLETKRKKINHGSVSWPNIAPTWVYQFSWRLRHAGRSQAESVSDPLWRYSLTRLMLVAWLPTPQPSPRGYHAVHTKYFVDQGRYHEKTPKHRVEHAAL